MKKYFLLFALVLQAGFAAAQQTYTIDGEALELQTEVEGELTLLWNIIDGEYRYFVEKDGNYVELVNTRQNGEYQEEYKRILADFTADANMETDDVKLVLYSLRNFANRYNAQVDSSYTYNTSSPTVQTRLGIFGGVSNNRYTNNPENVLVPVVGLEFEIIDPTMAFRHSAFFHLRQSFSAEDYDYTSTQLSLNYRFKLINKAAFKLHIDTELVNFYYSEDVIYLTDDNDVPTGATEERSGFSLQTPLTFGVGTDISIGRNSFLTLSYNDIVSLVLDDSGHFPVDFTVGYKMNL